MLSFIRAAITMVSLHSNKTLTMTPWSNNSVLKDSIVTIEHYRVLTNWLHIKMQGTDTTFHPWRQLLKPCIGRWATFLLYTRLWVQLPVLYWGRNGSWGQRSNLPLLDCSLKDKECWPNRFLLHRQMSLHAGCERQRWSYILSIKIKCMLC